MFDNTEQFEGIEKQLELLNKKIDAGKDKTDEDKPKDIKEDEDENDNGTIG